MKIIDGLDSELLVPDKEDWQREINIDPSKRKQEWRHIKPILKYIYKTSRGGGNFEYMSLHKQLFFTGEVDESYLRFLKGRAFPYGGANFLSRFPLFYLWYHPNLDRNKVADYLAFFNKQKFCGCGFNEVLFCIYKGLTILTKDYNRFDDYGMMGGKEKEILPFFLCSDSADTDQGFYIGLDKRFSIETLMKLMLSSGRFVFSDSKSSFYKGNPNHGAQDVWPLISAKIGRDISNDFMDRKVIYKEMFSELISHFFMLKSLGHDDELIMNFVNKIIGQYEGREFSNWLHKIFEAEEVKFHS